MLCAQSFVQAAQLSQIVDGKLKELAEDAGREKALKDVAEITAAEKLKAAEVAERRAAAAEEAKARAEGLRAELEKKLGDVQLQLATSESLKTAQGEEVTALKAALDACESKWYDEGFADAENSAEPVIRQAHKLGFEEGWLAALRAAGVPEDSPLRNLAEIPFPAQAAPAQAAPLVIDEEETSSMRALVEAIDSHAEPAGLEVTSDPRSDAPPS